VRKAIVYTLFIDNPLATAAITALTPHIESALGKIASWGIGKVKGWFGGGSSSS